MGSGWCWYVHWPFYAPAALLLRAMVPALKRTKGYWKYPVAGYAGFWLLFAIVVASTGIFVESKWIKNGTEPLYVERRGEFVALREAVMHVRMALADSEGNPNLLQKSFMEFSYRRRAPYWEDYNRIIFEQADGK